MRYRRTLSDSYYWKDILGKPLKITKQTAVYDLPDKKSQLIKYFSPGSITPNIESYNNRDGQLWLMVYLSQSDYDNQLSSWILLQDNKLSSSFEKPEDTLTVQQQQQAIIDANKPWYEKIFTDVGKTVKTVALVGLAIYGTVQISKASRK